MNVIVIAATSDIATELCVRWKKIGYQVTGTYFSKSSNYEMLTENEVPLVHCDLKKHDSIDEAAKKIEEIAPAWDSIIFAPGTQEPVGPFAKVSIDQWSDSIQVNFVNQLRLLHRLLPNRNPTKEEKSVIFFAGGGTNNTVLNYSAYTVSKIALIKMCELLDSEIEDVKFSILGPGWVKTKIHQATIEAGEGFAGANYQKTKEKLSSDECVPVDKVLDSIEWIMQQPKNVVGGRNFSTVFDRWGTQELSSLLSDNPDLYKLRRYGNEALVKN